MSGISINAVRSAKVNRVLPLKRMAVSEKFADKSFIKDAGKSSIKLKDYDYSPEMMQVDPDDPGGKEAGEKVLGGMAAGAAIGAAAGSFIPVAGTMGGALVGAFVGAGAAAVKGLVDLFRD